MGEENGAARAEEEKLWRFVPPHEFSTPSAPAREAVRQGITRFLQRFRSDETPPSLEEAEDPHGAALEDAALHRRLPPFMLEERGARLAEALEAAGGRGMPVVIDPPHAGGREALRHLAAVRGYRIAEAPPRATLLGEPETILATIEALDAQPLVVPALERLFLRTPQSLEALRLLLDRLQERTAPTVLGCGSWAWRFLEEAIEIDVSFQARLVPGPLDAARLHRWFSMPALRCVERSGGVLVGDGPCGDEPPEYLRRLAASARGSAGTARALWGEALRLPPPEEEPEESAAGNEDAEKRPRPDLLVVPWQQLKLPAFPGKAARDDLMLLQLLLLHDGLEETVARAMLPFEPARIGTRLRSLARAGLVACEDGLWHVPPLAYPSVRHELSSTGFWVDGY
ncbi:hypothetical protein [Marinimicrococcus flavescens]|uniref:Uncharacterized protein n=1 Tax=Marinimicrococcus flavescens TaxID=3031815 RepID=A0AAP4D596_9PROT|nr:hypothetical protein [Marinimicrococcus flavescens]